MSNNEYANPYTILMNGQTLNPKISLRLVCIDISDDLIGHENVVDLNFATGKKLEFQFRAGKYRATLYIAQIWSGLKYLLLPRLASATSTSFALFDAVQERFIRSYYQALASCHIATR